VNDPGTQSLPPTHIPPPAGGFGAPVPGDRLGVPEGAARTGPDPTRPRPSYFFLAFLSIFTLASDIATKAWAEKRLDGFQPSIDVWKDHVTLILAKNRGGAWGLLQATSENVRRPFFLLVSVAAIAFIVTLYRRLQPKQRALQWGLPLVLGGALGNVFDRIRYGHVINFIDVHGIWKGAEHHWPTFNVADIAICVGVGLMAIDMFTSKRKRPLPMEPVVEPPPPPAAPAPPPTEPLAQPVEGPKE
jgi:signal peptidase II